MEGGERSAALGPFHNNYITCYYYDHNISNTGARITVRTKFVPRFPPTDQVDGKRQHGYGTTNNVTTTITTTTTNTTDKVKILDSLTE